MRGEGSLDWILHGATIERLKQRNKRSGEGEGNKRFGEQERGEELGKVSSEEERDSWGEEG